MRGEATVPAPAAWALRFSTRWHRRRPPVVGGHDIGGAVAQDLAAHESRVEALVLMNSVLYDSWPVPAVAPFRDSAVADASATRARRPARVSNAYLGPAMTPPLTSQAGSPRR